EVFESAHVAECGPDRLLVSAPQPARFLAIEATALFGNPPQCAIDLAMLVGARRPAVAAIRPIRLDIDMGFAQYDVFTTMRFPPLMNCAVCVETAFLIEKAIRPRSLSLR